MSLLRHASKCTVLSLVVRDNLNNASKHLHHGDRVLFKEISPSSVLYNVVPTSFDTDCST